MTAGDLYRWDNPEHAKTLHAKQKVSFKVAQFAKQKVSF